MSMESASCTMDLPAGGPPEWIHLLPQGDFTGRDGRAWKLVNPRRVVTAFAVNGMDLPIDYEHQTEHAEKNGQPAPAAGWVKALDTRPDGIWGRVEWTAKAREMLEAREYRFLSPVFLFNRETREVIRLQSAGLTNRPNLILKALARQETPTMSDDFKAKVTEALGLSPEANDESIIGKIKAGATPDPAKYVPLEQVKELTAELAALKASMTDEQAENTVKMAMMQGKLPPALEAWGLALCRENPKAFSDFVGAAGPYVNLSTSIVPGGRPPRAGAALGEEERAVCQNLGISEAELRANLAKS